MGTLRAFSGASISFAASSILSALNSSVVGYFTRGLNLWLWVLNWVFMYLLYTVSVAFHGHVGPCRIRRLCSDIALGVYIYK